jgi:hypothetical protein
MPNLLAAFTLLCITAAFAPTSAQAAETKVISFDGLNPPQVMPEEYGGFHWTNWYLYDQYDPTFNNMYRPQTDAVSNVMNVHATSIISSDTPFNFLFASYQTDVPMYQYVTVSGYRSGYKLYEDNVCAGCMYLMPILWEHFFYTVDTVTFKESEPVMSKFSLSSIYYSYPDPGYGSNIYGLQAPPINLSYLSSNSSPGPGPGIQDFSASSATASGSQAATTSQAGASSGSQTSTSSGGTQTVTIQAPQINLQTLPTLGKR